MIQNSLSLLKLMILSRAIDKRQAIMLRQGKAHIHVSSAGHEGLMAIAYQLKADDYLYPYYRDASLMIAKGLSVKNLAQDFLAKASSSSAGKSMANHCGSRELNIFPSAAPTASQCLPATGTAWGKKLQGQSTVTLCSIGDGATREGDFYEAVCFAVQEQLPIIFLVQDNNYAISTSTLNMLPFRLDIFSQHIITQVNGRDVFEVYEKGKSAIQKAKANLGPSILWCQVDRLESHTAGEDHNLYRSKEELSALQDPIVLYSNKLIANRILNEEEFDRLVKDTEAEVLHLYKLVEQEVDPDPSLIENHLYGPKVVYPEVDCSSLTSPISMVEATNWILNKGLSNRSDIILFGQDIVDPKGGVFNFTQNLSNKYPGRVINAPVAESTIIGTAVGLSVMGFKPVFEIQFIDFITPGFDQLVTQVSSLRWRSCSKWSCPLILYAPYGAYLPAGGLWHSQSNDGWWCHIPGLRVGIPSTAQDIINLFWSAFHDHDPSLILIPKHIMRRKERVVQEAVIPFGLGKISKEGKDITIVAWGNTVEIAMNAAMIKEAESEITVEVIDLRTLVPYDFKVIERSIAKTGRLIIVHEDNKTCGFGSSIIAQIVTNTKSFELLYSPMALVAREDVHIPFHPNLEYAVLPSVEKVLNAIDSVINF